MGIDKFRMLKIRLETMKSKLLDSSGLQKSNHVTQTMADRFNETLRAIAEAEPELEIHLPAPITSKGPQKMLGLSDASYMDLEVFIDEIIAMISDLESGN